jgi:drug/metabolite transporter (DMT)-like permease
VNYLGEFAAIATACCWAVTSMFFSYSGRQVGSVVVNLSRLLFALVLMAFAHLWLQGSLLPLQAEPYRWGWLGLSSVLGLVIGDGSLFQAFVLLGPRLSILIMALVPIFSTFLGWLFLGETVSGLEFAGIVLAVSGVGWVVTEPRSGQTRVQARQYGLGILFGLGGALGQASGLIAAKFGLAGNFSAASANVVRMLVATLVLWGLAALRHDVGATVSHWRNRKVLLAILAGTVIGPVAGVWLSLVSIQLVRVGIASTLMALSPIILIPLSALFFKEKISNRSVLGTILALAGVGLIFWQ